MGGLKFSTGMAVEVNLDKESSNDDWFPAIVLEEVGFNSFLVACELRNNDESELMKSTVDSFHMRPPPPNLGVENYGLLEKVNAFDGLAWRDGFISKILTEGRYVVFLRHVKMEKQFSHLEMRPHLYFINGEWDTSIYSYCPEQSEHVINAKIPGVAIQLESSIATKDHDGERTPCARIRKNPKEQSTPNTKSKRTKVQRTALINEAALSRPSKKFKKEKSAYSLSSKSCHVKLMPIETPNQEASVGDGTTSKCPNHPVGGNQPSTESGSVFREKNLETNEQEAGLDSEMMASVVKKGLPPNSGVKGQQVPAAGVINKNGDSAEEIIEVEHITEEVCLSVVLDGGIGGLQVENSCLCPDEVIYLQKEDEAIQPEKKGEEQNVDDGIVNEMDFENSATKQVDLPAVTDVEPAASQDALAGISATVSSADYMAKEVEVVMTGGSCGTHNDQPLSLCSEGCSPDKTLNPCNGTREKQIETMMQSPIINVPVDSEPVEHQRMPFMKSSSLWERIESFEIFQSMPQKPHFYPLAKCNELSREGSAIGYMVTFATVVDKTSKLRVDDPKNLFDIYLETLNDLEMLGFDVRAVVDRLSKLLSIKDKREQFVHKSKEVEMQVAQLTHETSKLEEDIDAVGKMIRELEEKRAQDLSMKAMKDSVITALQSDASVINEDISNAEHDFQRLTAASW